MEYDVVTGIPRRLRKFLFNQILEVIRITFHRRNTGRLVRMPNIIGRRARFRSWRAFSLWRFESSRSQFY
jgi:hypothetical protein